MVKIMQIRVTEEQWADIQQDAEHHGISASQYVRETVLSRVAYDCARRGVTPRTVTLPAVTEVVQEALRADAVDSRADSSRDGHGP